MKLFHQTGHNYVWNIDSIKEDSAGDGLILSPVNMPYDKMKELPDETRKRCLFDPQFYLPKSEKGQFGSYDFFPTSMRDYFQTEDFSEIANDSAAQNIEFQNSMGFERILIPARYYEELPSHYYEELEEYFVDPYVRQANERGIADRLSATIVVKAIQLTDSAQRKELLNWITGLPVSGVYVIFENASPSKQIKESTVLSGALILIHGLKLNGLHVIVGYTNTESLLYSVAGADVVTMGSYENLRRFQPQRFQDTEEGSTRGPNPRLYIGSLLQWIDYSFIGPLQQLYPGFDNLVEDSVYRPLMFKPEFKWHFQKPELYKHHFIVLSNQIRKLPDSLEERTEYIQDIAKKAISTFEQITGRVTLDGDSDGSHLPHWLNAIALYRDHLQKLEL